MGQAAWSRVRAHPHLVNAVKGNATGRGLITKEEFAELFELNQLIVGQGLVNTARKGQAANMQRVWGKHLALLHINPAATNNSGVTFGFTAAWGDKVSGRMSDPKTGLYGSEVLRVGESVKEVICARDVGFLLQNIVD